MGENLMTSPNTTIDERFYKRVSGEAYETWKGGMSNIYYEDCTNEVKSLINTAVEEAKKEQSSKTSGWIEEHIRLLQRDESFLKCSSSVAFTYAADQARQGRIKALQKERNTK